MKRLAIIPTVFALVVMVAACTDTPVAVETDLEPQFARASQPNCIEVLTRFFAPIENEGVGLKTELEDIRFVADLFGIPTGTVISRVTQRTGTVDDCLGFLFGGG